ncbi:MAG: proton-conducting transporter membrane subunit [Elusimicrobiota bacterium]|nr:proton-conducting transporter membrane subunit [Elusimicrobiota bacterium]
MNALPVLIVATPLAAALVPPLLALASVRAAKAWSLAAQALCLALSIAALRAVLAGGPLRHALGGWPAPWGIECVLDAFSAALAVLVAGLAVLTTVYAWDWEDRRGPVREGAFQSLFLLLLAGLLGMLAAGDLFNLYVFLEIASLSSYALVAAGPGREAPLAAFRYLILGGAGATFWVLGLGYLYALTGTLNMADLSSRWPAISASPAAAAGLGLMVAGLALKMPVFPLHGWQPGAYAASPPQLMPFIASAGSKVMAYAIFRLLAGTLGSEGQAGRVLEALAPVGLLSVAAGSMLALTQTDVRRMLAYSSVAQLGLLFVGFSLGGRWAVIGVFWHMLAHAVLKSCLFMAAGSVARRRGSCEIDDFAGLGRTAPLTAFCFASAGLALIGLPPAAGFFGKWYLLRGALDAGAWVSLSVVAASGLMTALYVFRLLERMYLAPPPESKRVEPMGPWGAAPMLALAVAAILLGVFNQPLIAAFIEPARLAATGGRG